MSTRFVLAAAAAVFAGSVAVTPAAAYPDRPVRIIVPAAPGGASDVLARLVQPRLEEHLGGATAIINVEGGGTSIGSRQARDSDPDGYTLLLVQASLHTTYILGSADFSYEDFDVVAGTTHQPVVCAVGGDSPYDSVLDLLEDAKQNPDTILSASNLGGVNHLAALLLTSAYPGASFRFVQTGGGVGSATSIMGGHTAQGCFVTSEVLAFSEGGDLKPLITLARERDPALPDVPSTAELDLDAFYAIDYWWLMPKGSPQEAIDAVADALEAAMADPELRQALIDRGIQPTFNRGEDTLAQMKEQYDVTLQLARDAGLAKR